MKDSFYKINFMGRAFINGQMEINLKVFSIKIKKKVMAFINISMGINT